MKSTGPVSLALPSSMRTDPAAARRQQAVILSQQTLSFFWAGDLRRCSACFSDTITFLGPDFSSCVIGKQEVASCLKILYDDVSPLLPWYASRVEVQPIGPNTCAVISELRFPIAPRAEEGDDTGPDVREYRKLLCSMVWTSGGNEPFRLQLCHCSLSEDLSAGVEVEASSPDTSREKPDGHRVDQPRSSSPHIPHDKIDRMALQAHDSAGTTHWISPDQIVYVSAAHQYTDIHCLDRCIHLRSPFSGVLEQLGDNVVKVHRSYAVNPAYVSHMDNEMLHLINGTEVPIPVKRARQVRRLLSEHFIQMGKRQ